MKILTAIAAAALTVVITTSAQAFCGFYVARADTGLVNRSEPDSAATWRSGSHMRPARRNG